MSWLMARDGLVCSNCGVGTRVGLCDCRNNRYEHTSSSITCTKCGNKLTFWYCGCGHVNQSFVRGPAERGFNDGL